MISETHIIFWEVGVEKINLSKINHEKIEKGGLIFLFFY